MSNLHFLKTQPTESLETLRPGQSAREPRAKALLIASVSRLDNSHCTPCVVTNISSGGARLKISETVLLSEMFRLSIPQRNLTRLARQAWRKGDQLGLAFVTEAAPASEDADTAKDAKIRALEAEVAALKAELGALKYQMYRRE